MFQFFTPKKCVISNMGIYHFICGPRSYDAFPKWPARSFGLATPVLVHSLTDGGEVSLTLRLPFTLRRIPGTYSMKYGFLEELTVLSRYWFHF
jgi:hypothetical protein